MSAVHEMQNPGDPPVDISDHVLLPDIGTEGFRLSTQAEEGSVGSSELTLDDPDGAFYPIGLNAYRVREDTSEADDPLLFVGAFGSRREIRGPYRTGASRHVVAQIQDANSGLSRYVVRVDEDGNRPEETDEERIEWLFTTSGMALHWDISTSIIEPTGVTLAAADLTDYTPQQILDDMAQQGGNNYYVFIDGSVDPPEALLVYAPDTGTHLTSDLRFSNVIADVDDATTFYIGLDVEQEINPERVTSYVSVRYSTGRVDENDDETADIFSRIDRVMDAPFIKTAGVATSRALQYLNDLDTEETTVSGTVFLPAAKASQFRAGMRCEMKATHLTGMTDFVWVRLLAVTITQISEDPNLTYALAFEGTFTTSAASCALVLPDLEVDTVDHGASLPPWAGDSVTPGTGTFLAISFAVYGVGFTFAGDGDELQPTAPWIAMGVQPGNIGGTHTEFNVAYRQDAAGDPGWTAVTGIASAGGTTMGFVVPGGEFVQTATSLISGVPSWPATPTPGNMIILCRFAEGPSGFSEDPTAADIPMTLVELTTDVWTTAQTMEIWACCVTEENKNDLNSGEAASSWWGEMFEVTFP